MRPCSSTSAGSAAAELEKSCRQEEANGGGWHRARASSNLTPLPSSTSHTTHIQNDEGQHGAQINRAAQGGDYPPEQIEVRIADRGQRRHDCLGRVWEPGEDEAADQGGVVQLEEVAEAASEHHLGRAVARQDGSELRRLGATVCQVHVVGGGGARGRAEAQLIAAVLPAETVEAAGGGAAGGRAAVETLDSS